MVIDIRKLNTSDHECFAYTKSIIGKATYCLYFTDDITGAVILYNFVQMLRDYFKPAHIDIKVSDKEINIKNEFLLELLNN